MESWSCYKIEDLFEVKNGAAIQSKDFTLNKIDDSYMEVLKIGHIAIGGGLRKEPKKNYVHKTSKLDKFILQKGDIVMAMTDMKDNVTILGVSAMVEEDNKYILNQRVACLRKKTTIEFDDKFVYYQMRTRRFLLPLQKQANRGVQVNLTTDHIRNSIVFLPSLAEQKKISSLFTDIESKIDNNYKICKVLESQAQALFKNWFIDFAPFKDGKFIESELGMIPEGWRVGRLEEYVDNLSGYSYKGNELQPSTTAMATIKNFVRGGGFKIEGFKEIVISKNIKEYQYVNLLDVLVAHTDLTQNAEVVGNPAIILSTAGYEKLIMSMDLTKVVSKDTRITSPLLHSILSTRKFKEHALGYVNGTTVLHMSKKAVPEFQLAMPKNLDILKNLTTILDDLYYMMSEAHQENLRLSTLRDTLLPKLMSGEIKV